MKRHWETFEGKQNMRTLASEPRVTLGSKGTFYMNGSAYDALQQPAAAVEMLYDGNERIIGLKPVDLRKRNAFLIKPHGKTGNYKRISASAFCTHFRLKFPRTILFNEIDLDPDGVLILDINKTTTIGRGSR